MLMEKIILVGANNHGGWDTCLYSILLDLRGISRIVDLNVALKGENGLVITNSNTKNNDMNHSSEGCTTQQVRHGSAVLVSSVYRME